MMTALDHQHTVAPPGYSRWLIPPAALSVHLCIGQAYATSVYKNSLIAHFDASQTAIGVIFSIAIVMLGLSAALGGTWVESNGPRKAMFVSASFWAAGFLVGALGIATGQLWLVYLGYGFLGGIGLGIGYISPVSTLIKWFPDRPGLATGLAIMGFGGGAMLASPLSRQLLSLYDPGYDPANSASVASGGALVGLFVTLGIGYFAIMMFGVFNVRVPAPGWRPAGFDPGTVAAKPLVTTANVSASNAIRTRSFWLLWIALFCNVTAGIGILEQASPMIQDFFRDGGTSSVTIAAAGGFVGLLSLFNMAGRFAWSSTSDVIGRKPIYMVYLGVGMVLYALLALVGSTATALFVLLACVILSFYGGGFATVPAYLRDLFGTYQVGAIHGRLLTAWSAAGIAGPLIINGFLDAQGKPGTLTAAAYQPALFTMVGVLAIGFVANLLIRPVPDRFHEPARTTDAPVPEPTEGERPDPTTPAATAADATGTERSSTR
ncbi:MULTISPECIES: OFA family MFS transporter [unclassified Plantactinospora]|uniref:OFA family MFS transporter n=1 Tax=unclassified Plantactinospora TaxID=2631981 RepID=UPI000D17D760|nr:MULTISPECIES: OFA family MFS transporter [unclassified Plantactinospora]AVT34110.1 MFS transporter [Plantactinospora sp. BC1]AVT41609.1 MFS transporter [Plantactinospora sp. BB1]